ncbi:MAG TPA: NCS2 family permease [Mycobacteriales bacterium]|jgi:AGZA family xanthine/uracil permease-like MFS transporter|nr:NCS2 family permease [Mycobacteriales bacterium]
MSTSTEAPIDPTPLSRRPTNPVDRFFQISERGSTVQREMRGGLATFWTMAYIVVLNPIILAGATDKFGHHLSVPQLVTVTALAAAIMTLIMGVGGNLPLAIAAGLGLNGVVAFQLAPTMSWSSAMGLVVLEGLGIVVLVVTGLRQAIMDAIPMDLKHAISVGIGLFIAFIGLVDAGFVTPAQGTPVQMGQGGHLSGWPVLVFVIGMLLTFVLLVRRVPGAILISIIVSTALAIVINAVADIPSKSWGLIVPALPKDPVSSPDFGLIGHFDVAGAWSQAGAVTALVFMFTLILSDFFDAMGTIVGISAQAGLLDERGRPPRIGRVLFIDGLAAVAGGSFSASSNTAFIESSAGVGEGARTGFANLVTAALFAGVLFLTPLATIVPQQAATPALVAVGFMMMTQVRHIDWTRWELAFPAFFTIVLMPFTYSITNGIGAGFITYVLIKTARGQWREPGILLWIVSLFFAAYFAIGPIEQALGVK